MAENVESNTSLNSDENAAVSMLDVLEDERQLEEDANAVLGGSDDKNCTYYMGSVPRQALYSCITCIGVSGKEFAGICLACSLECHEGHDLVELYTKRNFRCDCGNAKFGEFKCKLIPDKAERNEDNVYNHNFIGKYCICDRPYPDPECENDDEMLQCIVCEDWFHSGHLNVEVPEEYDEMICASCMKKCDFLWPYTLISSEIVKIEKSDNKDPVDVETSPKKQKKAAEGDTGSKTEVKDEAVAGTSSESLTKLTECKKKELEARDVKKHEGATFWKEKWRSKLCKCSSCMTLYETIGVNFLMDENDTITAYEEKGKNKQKDQYQDGLQALSGMNRLQQVEMLHGFNDMKSELTDYLKKFAENKKVVKEEDIREFFQQLSAKKKQKTSHHSYFCK